MITHGPRLPSIETLSDSSLVRESDALSHTSSRMPAAACLTSAILELRLAPANVRDCTHLVAIFALHITFARKATNPKMQSDIVPIDPICAICQNWLTGEEHGHVAVIPGFLSEPLSSCPACHGMFAALVHTCDDILHDLMQRDAEPLFVTALVPDVCRSMEAFAAVHKLQPAIDSRLYMRWVTMSMLKTKHPALQLQKNGSISVEVIVNTRADAPERKHSRSDSMPMKLVENFAHLEIGFNVVREPMCVSLLFVSCINICAVSPTRFLQICNWELREAMQAHVSNALAGH